VAMVPSLRLREAVMVHLGSTAVANTLPAGGAIGVGVSWAMLSSRGISAADNMVYALVSGLWNTAARLGLPILALAILAVTGDTNTGLIAAAVAGLALLLISTTGAFLVLHRDSGRATQAVERLLALAFRLRRRPTPPRPGPALADFRVRTSALLAARGGRITLATAMVHLSLALVLFTCLYASGVTQAQVPWQTALAAFAFARLLSALPITPGGLGVVELGLTGFLSAGQDAPTTAKIAAAVLLFRAVTYLLPIPLGAAAYLAWQNNPTWRMNSQTRTAMNNKPRRHRHDRTVDQSTTPPCPAPPSPNSNNIEATNALTSGPNGSLGNLSGS
jgi:putative heme transporter